MSKIKAMRDRLGLSQSELGQEMHVSQQTVAAWENGTRMPRAATLIQLAAFFSCSIDDLIGEGVPKDAKQEQATC